MDYFEYLFSDSDDDENNYNEKSKIKDLEVVLSDSECSYDFTITRMDLTDYIIAIMFSKWWLFFTSLNAFLLYFMDSYTVLFYPELMYRLEALIIRHMMNTIVLCDTCFMIIRLSKDSGSSRNMYKDQPKVLTIMDICTSSVILIDLMFVWFSPAPGLINLRLLILFVRNYKIFSYFYNLITNDIADTKFITGTRYMLLYSFVMHTFLCGFRLLCTRCNIDKYPKNTIYGSDYYLKLTKYNYLAGLHDEQESVHWEVYTLTLFHVFGQTSSMGYSIPSARNNGEQLLSILLIIVATVLEIQFLSEVYCLTYISRKVLANYSNKLQLIARRLTGGGISDITRKQIINYYLTVWEKEKDLDLESYTYLLPKPMVKDINLDKYCIAINQMYFFYDQPLSVKRMIANLMTTSYYHKNDVIEEQGSYRYKVQFIACGSVAVLSEEDAESPLLNLGMGACLGEPNLFYPQACRFSLVAKSYTVMYSLSTDDLWRFESIRYTSSIECIRSKMKKRLSFAKNYISERGYNERALMAIKEQLIDESVLNIYDDRKQTAKERSDSPLDGYIVSMIQNEMSADAIFFSSHFLWKLQENSKFIWFWDTMITIIIILLLFIWPYLIYFLMEDVTFAVHYYGVNFTVFFILDVIVQLLTVCETKAGIFYKIRDIFRHRLSLLFFFDIASSLPLSWFLRSTASRLVYIITHSVILLKLFKLPVFINKVQKRFLFVKLVRIDLAKYVLYLFIASYITAWLYYVLVCYEGNDECLVGSWLYIIKENMKNNQGSANMYHNYRFMLLIQYSIMIWTTTAWCTSYTMVDIVVLFILSIASLLVYIFFIAEFSASGTLGNEIRYKYITKVDNMEQYMDKHYIMIGMKKITLQYLEAQWDYDWNLRDRSLFWGLPEKLFDEVQIEYYIKLFKDEPLFSMVDTETLNLIASRCRTLLVPPGAIIVHGGVLVDEMYIINSGYCQLTTPLTKKVKAVLGPRCSLCVLECLLGEGNIYDISAVTHVSLAIIKREDLLRAFAASPLKLTDQLADAISTIKNMNSRIFTGHNTQAIHYLDMEEDHSSWVVFSRTRNILHYIDYKEKFRNRSWGRFLRLFLMARTLKPNGPFFNRWEMFRNLLAWLTCTCYPAKYIYVSFLPNFPNLLYILDIFMMIDVYLQCHVCYYNRRAILVSHPYYTCKNYLTTRFALEFLGAIPLGRIIRSFTDIESTEHPNHYLYEILGDLNKLFLLSRTRRLLDEKNVLEKPQICRRMLYFSMILILFYNFFACLLTYGTVDFYRENGLVKMTPKKNSWYIPMKVPTDADALVLYVYAYELLALDMLNATPIMQLNIFDLTQSIFRIICATLGYLFFAYSTVKLSLYFKINRKVSEYELNIKELREFLKRENISKELTKTALEHYDHIWRRTAQVFYSICQINSMSIRQDYALLIYGETVSKCIPFLDCDNSFKRHIGIHFKDEYYKMDSEIILLNDIVQNVFILHSGTVTVHAADGSLLETLGRGSVFGNFDEMKMIRSMITAKAKNDVELIRMRTDRLDEVFTGYSDMLFKLRQHCKLNSLGYIPGKAQPRNRDVSHQKIKKIVTTPLYKYYSSMYPIILDIFFGLATYLSVTTLWAFDAGLGIVELIHILDVLVLIKMILDMLKYARVQGLHFGIRLGKGVRKFNLILIGISIIPFNLIFLFIPKEPIIAYYLTFSNRLLRVVVLLKYIQSINFSKNKHAVMGKLGVIIMFSILTVHTGSCLLYNLSPQGLHSWTYRNGEAICDVYYVCATFMSLTYFTARGNELTLSENIRDSTVTIVYTTVSKYVYSVIVGSVIGITAHVKFNYMEFNFVAGKLERFLEKSNISSCLLQKVRRYLTNIYLKNEGKQYPPFMTTAPRVLRCKIKMEAFGMHIYNNVFFHGCHVDFIRQLVSHIQLSHFFYGDTICHAGSINRTMYFVHRGQVDVIAERKMEFEVIDVLSPGDCFGIIQGLYKTKEHMFTYVARNITEVLTLNYDDWNYLLTFFPASKFAIFEELIRRKIANAKKPDTLSSNT